MVYQTECLIIFYISIIILSKYIISTIIFIHFVKFFPLFTGIWGKKFILPKIVFLIFYGNLGKFKLFSHILRNFGEGDFFQSKKLFPIFYGKTGNSYHFFPHFTEKRVKIILFLTFYGNLGQEICDFKKSFSKKLRKIRKRRDFFPLFTENQVFRMSFSHILRKIGGGWMR